MLNSYYCKQSTVTQQRRPSSEKKDSVSEFERFLEKPSVPLAAKGPPGPPRIVEIEEKYSAIEGLYNHFYGI